MPLILCIETATDVCAVALGDGETGLLAERRLAEGRGHQALMPFIAEVLEEAGARIQDLSAIAVSIGPGSYTGLRIGLSAAKGLAMAGSRPLICIDTLAALAEASRQQYPGQIYVPMIDARRMEVYCQVQDAQGQLLAATQAHVLGADSFSAYRQPGRSLVLSGDGAGKWLDTMEPAEGILHSGLLCEAAHLLPLALRAWENGAFDHLAYAVPIYLKAPHITSPKAVL